MNEMKEKTSRETRESKMQSIPSGSQESVPEEGPVPEEEGGKGSVPEGKGPVRPVPEGEGPVPEGKGLVQPVPGGEGPVLEGERSVPEEEELVPEVPEIRTSKPSCPGRPHHPPRIGICDFCFVSPFSAASLSV